MTVVVVVVVDDLEDDEDDDEDELGDENVGARILLRLFLYEYYLFNSNLVLSYKLFSFYFSILFYNYSISYSDISILLDASFTFSSIVIFE